MNIDVELIEKVVKKVLNDVETGSSESEYGYGIFDTMDEAIEASAKAQKEYMNHSMADRQRYVEGIREVVCTKENLEYMSKLAVEESGMGAYEYKVIKNRLAAVKSPGVEDLTTEALSGDDGLTLVEYCPFGVIGAIAPTTNPTETVGDGGWRPRRRSPRQKCENIPVGRCPFGRRTPGRESGWQRRQ